MTTIMPNEEQLLTFNEEELVLTTRRIQMADMDRGNVELPLEQVNSITIRRRGYKLLFVPGCICLLAGASLFGTSYSNQFQVALIAGIILLMFWWATRKRTIAVASEKGGVSNVDVDEMTSEEIASLIDDIEVARNQRLSEIKQGSKNGNKAKI
jgi:hypothetical protein